MTVDTLERLRERAGGVLHDESLARLSHRRNGVLTLPA